MRQTKIIGSSPIKVVEVQTFLSQCYHTEGSMHFPKGHKQCKISQLNSFLFVIGESIKLKIV